MRTFCICCPELEARKFAAQDRFAGLGMDVEFFHGIHAETFGVLGVHPYRDTNGNEFVMGYRQTGLYLSHYMLWSALALLPDNEWMIVEDDADFPKDWKKRLDPALKDAPEDTDILLVGSSNASDKPRKQIKDAIWSVQWPFCTHAYVVRKKALPVLLQRMRDVYTKIDIALQERAYPHLNVYTILPRIASQTKTELMP